MTSLDLLMTFGVPALILVVIVVAVAAAYLNHRARQQAWSELAALTGLTCESAGLFGLSLRVQGVYRGHALTLDTFTRSSGKHSTTYTRVVIRVNNTAAIRLVLHEEGLLSPVGKLLGLQDIQVGDQDLDRRFIIQGQPEDIIARLLSLGGLRDKLLQARSLNIKVEGQELHFEQRGVELNVDYLQYLFDLLSELVEEIEQVGGPSFTQPVSSASGWPSSLASQR
jgi:hypothetical protein